MKSDRLFSEIRKKRNSNARHLYFAVITNNVFFDYIFSIISLGLIVFSIIFQKHNQLLSGLASAFALVSLIPNKAYSKDDTNKSASVRLELFHKFEELEIKYESKIVTKEEAMVEFVALNEYEGKLWHKINKRPY